MAVFNRRLLLLLLLFRRRRWRRRERKHNWARHFFKKTIQLGEYHSLVNEMQLTDHQSFYRYFHMPPKTFAHLLSLVGPGITRQTTSFCQLIQVNERFAIWWLVTPFHLTTYWSFNCLWHYCNALWNVVSRKYFRRSSTAEE